MEESCSNEYPENGEWGEDEFQFRPVKNTKTCNKCGEEKPLNQFSKDSSRESNNGYSYRCKSCDKDYRTNNFISMNGQEKNREGVSNAKTKDGVSIPLFRPKGNTEIFLYQLVEQGKENIQEYQDRIAQLEGYYIQYRDESEERIRKLRSKLEQRIKKLKNKNFNLRSELKMLHAEHELEQRRIQQDQDSGLGGIADRVLGNEQALNNITSIGKTLVSAWASKLSNSSLDGAEREVEEVRSKSEYHDHLMNCLLKMDRIEAFVVGEYLKMKHFADSVQKVKSQTSQENTPGNESPDREAHNHSQPNL
ncbi:hypothetical protein KFE98_01630 [bacterium SCSIO 12741]|nr:hypothetical protein KFE98_01630 [bacterium SCSIO 12741]